MINYLKCENYRLLRKKNLYITSIICFSLIIAAAVILYGSQKNDPNFPYATSLFFYSNVIGSGLLVLIVAFIFNLALTGKDSSLIKQSVSFGISRNTIFWSKLLLTVSYFLIICLIGLVLMMSLGEILLDSDEQSVRHFLIASLNMLPIVLSGFFAIHTLKMLKVSDVYIMIVLLFIFMFSGDLLRLIPESISGLSELYKLAPNTLLNKNLMNFMDASTQFDYRCWVTGILISVIFLMIGSKQFAKLNID